MNALIVNVNQIPKSSKRGNFAESSSSCFSAGLWYTFYNRRYVSCVLSCHVMCDLRHHVHDPVHVAAAVELHRVVRDGAVLGPLQQRHRRLP